MQVRELDTTAIDYINNLEIKNTKLETENKKLKENIIELNEYKNKYLSTKEQLDLLLWKRFGRSAEQLKDEPNQPLLFTEEAVQETTEEKENEPTQTVASYKRKKPGRKPLNPNLPRKEVIIDIPECDKTCVCGKKLSRIGEETSEKLHIIPAQIYVEQTVRPKYACRHCEGVETEGVTPTIRIAPVPPSIIPKSITSPSLLSTVFTYKFERHLPYYRQEKLYEQIGADISHQDMANWQQQVYEKLNPLFALLKETVKSGPVIQMDETSVQVMGEENRKDTQKSYMWLARGGPPNKTVIWYEYHPTRSAYNAKEFLSGYSGYLQTDGYKGYDTAVEDMPGIIHVGCFAHARRKFYEASKVNKQSHSAQEGMKHIQNLYRVENELRSHGLDEKTFLNERKAKVEPLLEKFKTWLLKRKDGVLDSSMLGKAINYSLSEWPKLIKYLECSELTPDNNLCENGIRPFVLGRKNWLFCKSPEGAESSCGMFTLIESAKQNGLVPFDYLMALFEKSPLASTQEDWEKLLPWNIFHRLN
jgi:transposase